MLFEWDINKENFTNRKKHGIEFEVALLVFQDPFLVSVADLHHYEERWQSIGLIHDVVIYVVHTIVEENNEEVIWIYLGKKKLRRVERNNVIMPTEKVLKELKALSRNEK